MSEGQLLRRNLDGRVREVLRLSGPIDKSDVKWRYELAKSAWEYLSVAKS